METPILNARARNIRYIRAGSDSAFTIRGPDPGAVSADLPQRHLRIPANSA